MSEKGYTPVLTAELDALYVKFAEMESKLTAQAATIAQLQQELEYAETQLLELGERDE